jgi:hypothetical protein
MVKARSEESCQAGAEIKRCPEEDTGHGCQLPTDGLDQRLVREKIFWAQAATAGSRPHGVDVEQERQVHRARRAAAYTALRLRVVCTGQGADRALVLVPPSLASSPHLRTSLIHG